MFTDIWWKQLVSVIEKEVESFSCPVNERNFEGTKMISCCKLTKIYILVPNANGLQNGKLSNWAQIHNKIISLLLMICNGIRIIWVWKHFVAQRLLYTKSCQMQDKPHRWYQICRHPKNLMSVVVYEFLYLL